MPTETAQTTGLVLGVVTVLFVSLVFLRRRIFHYTAECWFCCQRITITYFKRNSFTCPHCEQYNGFDKEGDYNKPIPAMYNEHLNQRRIHTELSGQPPVRHKFLCSSCEGNQNVKIRQLASFVPYSEVTFETEFKDFQLHLEELYKLCPPCVLRVNQEIERQDQVLGPNLQYYQLRKQEIQTRQPSRWLYIVILSLIRLAACGFIFFLFARDVSYMLGIKEKDQEKWIRCADQNQNSIAVAGLSLFILSVLLSGRERLKKVDAVYLALFAAVFVCTFPIPVYLSNINALPIYLQKILVNDGCRCFVSTLCLLTSIVWSMSHFLSLVRPKKTKQLPAVLDQEDSELGSEVSSDDEVDGDPQPSRIVTPLQPLPDQRGPVRNGIDSLSLGPPQETPKKKQVPQPQSFPKPDKDEDSTSGIDGSEDEVYSSISRNRRRKDREELPRRETDSTRLLPLFGAVLFGVSIGLNLSAAMYLYYTRT